jgi:hypothetical protein
MRRPRPELDCCATGKGKYVPILLYKYVHGMDNVKEFVVSGKKGRVKKYRRGENK